MKDFAPDTDELDPTETPVDDQATDEAGPAPEDGQEPDAGDVDADVGDQDGVEDGDQLDAELLGLREEFAELNDRHLRLAAEFNNFRRRVEAERLELWARAQAELVGKFLDVLDDLQRVAGLDLDNATVEAIMEGIDLVDRKFVRVLADAGIEVLDPVGEAFDPNVMEAMMRVPAEGDQEDDTVAQVFQKGYALKGVLIRPARVSVYKHG